MNRSVIISLWNRILNHKKKVVFAGTITAALIVVIVWVVLDNMKIDVTNYEITSQRLPEEFDGFVIVQISDFHNSTFGQDNDVLLDKVSQCHPDIIVITGDHIDSRQTDPEVSLRFTGSLLKIAPVYYVTGNHEQRLGDVSELFMYRLTKIGVTVLRHRCVKLGYHGATVNIMGIDDPMYLDSSRNSTMIPDKIARQIQEIPRDDDYTILLAHRPEVFDVYCEAGIDLVFSGHAHGGQFRLPFLGPLYAPSEGIFPKYAQGVSYHGNTAMVVSRGLGKSLFPFRLNNSPELVCVTLHKNNSP